MPNPDTVTHCYDCGKSWDEAKRATGKRRNRVVRFRRCVDCHNKYGRIKSQEYRSRIKAGQQPLAKRNSRAKQSQILGPKYSDVERRIAEYRSVVEKAQINKKTGEAKYDLPLDHRPLWQ